MKDNSKARKVLSEYRKLHGVTACSCGDASCDNVSNSAWGRTVDKERKELQAQLALLPHVMNKRESKLARQKAAKENKGRRNG